MSEQTISWLRGLAAKGGKGVVNNIDARCLGRIADELQAAEGQLQQWRTAETRRRASRRRKAKQRLALVGGQQGD